MADQGVVADALTTFLKDYKLGADQATGVIGQMTATVAAGKMHWDDYAHSLQTVLPVASALGIPIQEVNAAVATMTAHGVDAARATTGLRFGLTALVDATPKAAAAMEDLGISHDELAAKIATGDLSGTLQAIAAAMTKNLPEAARQQMAERRSKSGRGWTRTRCSQRSRPRPGPPTLECSPTISNMFGGARGGIMALNLLPNMDEYLPTWPPSGRPRRGRRRSRKPGPWSRRTSTRRWPRSMPR